MNLSARDKFDAEESVRVREALFDLAESVLRSELEHSDSMDRVDVLQRLLGEDICRRLGIFRIPAGFVLSVVMPVFNEIRTIDKVIIAVRDCGLPVELVIVDDGSTDGTRDILKRYEQTPGVKIILHEKNQGKGAALRTGFKNVTGNVVVVQDADLEYNPRELGLLLQPIIENQADVVYGSRFSGADRRVSPLWHQTGNQVLTFLANLFTGLKLTDVETCYKMMRREHLSQIAPSLQEGGFGIEIELTAKLAKIKGIRFHERPIGYIRRTWSEGKKIGLKDAFRAVWCMLRY